MATKRRTKKGAKARMPMNGARMLRETMVMALGDERRQPIYNLLTQHGVRIDNLARVSDWMNGAVGVRLPRHVLEVCNALRIVHGATIWTDKEIDRALLEDERLHEHGARLVRARRGRRASSDAQTSLPHIPKAAPKKARGARVLARAVMVVTPDLSALSGLKLIV